MEKKKQAIKQTNKNSQNTAADSICGSLQDRTSGALIILESVCQHRHFGIGRIWEWTA